LEPIAALVAQEASEKLGGEIAISCMRPMQAYDAGSRSRALLTVTQALAAAKESGFSPEALGAALKLVDWE
jgi:hypothetical protein